MTFKTVDGTPSPAPPAPTHHHSRPRTPPPYWRTYRRTGPTPRSSADTRKAGCPSGGSFTLSMDWQSTYATTPTSVALICLGTGACSATAPLCQPVYRTGTAFSPFSRLCRPRRSTCKNASTNSRPPRGSAGSGHHRWRSSVTTFGSDGCRTTLPHGRKVDQGATLHHPAPPRTTPQNLIPRPHRPGADRNWRRRDGVVTKVEGGQLDVAFTDRGKAARTYPLADWCVAVVPAGY